MTRVIRGANGIGRVWGGAALITVGVLVTACGGGTKAATAPTTAAGSSRSTAVTTATSAPATTAPVSLSGSFCEKSREFEKMEDSMAEMESEGTPAQLKTLFEQQEELLPEFVSDAPSQIKGAVDTLATLDMSLFNALQANNFNFTNLPPSVAASLQSPAVTQASMALENYETSVCGLNTSIPSS